MIRRLLIAVTAMSLSLWVGSNLFGRGRLASAADALEAGDAPAARELLTAGAGLPLSPPGLRTLSHAARASGDPLLALAALRAAWEIAPRDVDVQHDLAWQRDQLTDALRPVGPARPWLIVMGPGEAATVACLLTAVASAIAVAAARRRARPLVAAVAALSAVVVDAAALDAWAQLDGQPVAVVGQPSVARDGPSFGDAERHTLPPGSEVRVRRHAGAFVLVEDGTGRRGWVVRDTLVLAP